jgi:hypothetical protein
VGRLACGGAGQSRGRRRFVQRWGRKTNCEAGGDRRGEESRQGRRGRRWLEETVGVPPRPPAIGSNPVDGSGSWAATGPYFFNWLAQLWALLVLPSRDILRPSFTAIFLGGGLFWIVNTNTQSSHYNTASARFRLKYSGVCSNTSRQEPTCTIC